MSTVDSTIQKLWQASSTILIIANTRSNADILFASLAILELCKQNNKDVVMYSPTLSNDKIWKYKFSKDVFSSIRSDLHAQTAIEIPASDIDIKSVDLIKTSKGYRIILDTNNPNQKHKFKPRLINTKSNYDLVIVVGPPTLNENLLNLSSEYIYISNQNITNQIPNQNSLLYKGSAKAFTLKVVEMFHTINVELSPDIATYLLSGLFSYSATFTKNISSKLFMTITELIKLGGNYHESLSNAINTLSIGNVRVIGQGLSEIKQHKNGLFSYLLTKEQGKSNSLKPKDLFKINEIYNCKLALVFIEGEEHNKAYLKTSFKETGLKKILKDSQGKGSNYDGLIVTTDSYDSLCNNLIQLLEKI